MSNDADGEGHIFCLAAECDSLFESASGSLSSKDEILVKLEEFRGRFKEWTSYLGVFAPEDVNLDRRLRHHGELRDLVLLALDFLRVNLIQLLPSDQRSTASSDSDLSDDSDSSCVALNGIGDALSQFGRLAISIRQSSTSNLTTRVKAFAGRKLQLSDFETVALLAVQALYPSAAKSLHRLLSKSMTERHARLSYWRFHDKKLRADRRRSGPTWDKALTAALNDGPRVRARNSLPKNPERATAGTQQQRTIYSETVPSGVNTQLPKELEGVLVQKNRRVGGASSVQIGEFSYPPEPKLADGKFGGPCEFCRKVLDTVRYEDPLFWRTHVDDDLKPYVCLGEDCFERPALSRFTDWKEHMNAEHGSDWAQSTHRAPTWLCNLDGGGHEKTELFSSIGQLQAHLEMNHETTDTLGAARNDHSSVVYLERPAGVCPLCCLPLEETNQQQRVSRTAPGGNETSPSSVSTPTSDPAGEAQVSTKKGKKKEVNWGTDLSSAEVLDIPSANDRPKRQVGDVNPSKTLVVSQHIAKHLKYLSFLTLRLLSGEFKEASVSPDFDSVEIDSQISDFGDRYTISDDWQEPVEQQLDLQGEEEQENRPPSVRSDHKDWREMEIPQSKTWNADEDEALNHIARAQELSKSSKNDTGGGATDSNHPLSSIDSHSEDPPTRSMPHKFLGLDDPHLVEHCYDRGEAYYKSDTGLGDIAGNVQSSVSNADSESKSDGEDAVRRAAEQLDKFKIAHPKGTSGYFIPRECLKSILSFPNILKIVKCLNCCRNLDLDDFRRRELATKIFRDYRLLLATLIDADEAESLISLMREGLKDKCLPLRLRENDDPGEDAPMIELNCKMKDHNHPTVNCWSRDNRRYNFLTSSHAVLSPYFKRTPYGRHRHYYLTLNDVLPILEMGPPQRPDDHTDQGDPKDSVGGNGVGGFGEVSYVKLHNSHFDFGDYGIGGHDGEFDMKKLISSDRDEFNRELASLLRFRMDNDKHLIKVLATFQIPKPSKKGGESNYYLLFPRADGDLWGLWRDSRNRLGDRSLLPWMAEESVALVEALNSVHEGRDRDLENIDARNRRGLSRELFGIHGDIKAQNILVFSAGEGKMKTILSDFGLGHLHAKVLRSNGNPKKFPHTAAYKAPEFDVPGGKISRVSDIFSLGCTFLEWITWWAEGYESVHDKFPTERMEVDAHGFISDTFFRTDGPVDANGKKQPILKPKVTEWIQKLRENPHSSHYVIEFLNCIEDMMLEPDPSKRTPSNLLSKELTLLKLACRSPSFYLNDPVPELRMPRPSSSRWRRRKGVDD